MKKSYLVGYYGMKNTGDDALMNVAAWGAKRYLNVEKIYLSSPRPLKLYSGEKIESSLCKTQRFPGQNRFKHYLSAIDSNQVIFGGGSVLHNTHDINLKRDMMTLSGGRSHFALGVGIGPFANLRAEKTCARFLSSCKYVGVRDQLSYDIAQSIAPNANVDLTFDLAPQLLLVDGFKLQSVHRQGIAVCLCPNERLKGDSNAEDKRLRSLARSLDTISFFTGEPICFVDFNGHSELGDEPVHRELASMLSPTTKFSFIQYDANPFRVLQRMATFKLAICMRLHAAIFSFIAQTPVVSLNYHSKCKQWCNQVGIQNQYVFDSADFDPQELVNSVCIGVADGFTPPQMAVNQAVGLSMKNWRMSYGYTKQENVFGCYSPLQ